jgi:hypothetical protein
MLASRVDLGVAYLAAGEPTKAEQPHGDGLEWAPEQFGEADSRTAGAMAQLGMDLIQQRNWAEAEPLVRGCLAIREPIQPDDRTAFNTRSMLGGSLLVQNRYAEAEPLILSGYEGPRARETNIPGQHKPRLTGAFERVIALYDAWGKKNKADQCRKKRYQLQTYSHCRRRPRVGHPMTCGTRSRGGTTARGSGTPPQPTSLASPATR